MNQKSMRSSRMRNDVEDGALIGNQVSFAVSEAYKLLRTNLMFSLPDEQRCRVIGITSALRGEGKSTTSINLAYTLAETGKKVLLMELDLRLPTIAKRLKALPKPGLSNLLVGLNSGQDVIQRSGLKPNLYVVTAGDIPPNPSELLGSKQFEVTVEAFSKVFDYIIFDLPPVNAVSDALVVSKLIDGMVMVVRRDYNDQRELAEAMRQLEFADTKVLGFVMTQGESAEKRYGKNSYKYGDKYGYGYRKPTDNGTKNP